MSSKLIVHNFFFFFFCLDTVLDPFEFYLSLSSVFSWSGRGDRASSVALPVTLADCALQRDTRLVKLKQKFVEVFDLVMYDALWW